MEVCVRKLSVIRLSKEEIEMIRLQGFEVDSYGVITKCTLPNEVESIHVPDGVLRIHDGVFRGRNALIEVRLPETLTVIEVEAFCDCGALVSVLFPRAVRKIGERAFSGCGALAEVSMPNNLEYLGRDAFAGTPWLRSITNEDGFAIYGHTLVRYHGTNPHVTIPERVTLINRGAFYDCDFITKVTLPYVLACIGCEAFAGCIALSVIENFFVVTQIEYIEADAFVDTLWLEEKLDENGFMIYDSALLGYRGTGTHVTIPDGIQFIADATFMHCEEMTHVTIPDSVAYIGCEAFFGCQNLARVEMGNLSFIDDQAFADTAWICSITDENGFMIYDSCLLRYEGKEENVMIPDSVMVINTRAFLDCDFIRNILIPNSVTLIGREAFSGCTSLVVLVIPDSVEDIEVGALKHCRFENLTLPNDYKNNLSYIFAERDVDSSEFYFY